MTVLSPEQAARNLLTLSKGMKKTVTGPMNAARNEARKQTRSDYLNKRPGKSIFARSKNDPGKPRFVIKSTSARFSRSRGVFVVGFDLKGMAAILEEGGKTKPHRIRPKRASILMLQLPTGTAFARAANHPGSRFRSHGIGEKALQVSFRNLPREIDKSLKGAIRSSGLT